MENLIGYFFLLYCWWIRDQRNFMKLLLKSEHRTCEHQQQLSKKLNFLWAQSGSRRKKVDRISEAWTRCECSTRFSLSFIRLTQTLHQRTCMHGELNAENWTFVKWTPIYDVYDVDGRNYFFMNSLSPFANPRLISNSHWRSLINVSELQRSFLLLWFSLYFPLTIFSTCNLKKWTEMVYENKNLCCVLCCLSLSLIGEQTKNCKINTPASNELNENWGKWFESWKRMIYGKIGSILRKKCFHFGFCCKPLIESWEISLKDFRFYCANICNSLQNVKCGNDEIESFSCERSSTWVQLTYYMIKKSYYIFHVLHCRWPVDGLLFKRKRSSILYHWKSKAVRSDTFEFWENQRKNWHALTNIYQVSVLIKNEKKLQTLIFQNLEWRWSLLSSTLTSNYLVVEVTIVKYWTFYRIVLIGKMFCTFVNEKSK